jgi:peptidyl-prolyl cis-trans isomerase B (cyclophilin B)
MKTVNRINLTKLSKLLLIAITTLSSSLTIMAPTEADAIDPSLLPPDVTIPTAVSPAVQTSAGAEAGGQAPGLAGGGMPNSPIMNRRGLPMSASGVVQGGTPNSAPPGMTFNSNAPANPYSRGNGSTPMPTDMTNPQSMQNLTPELQQLQQAMQQRSGGQTGASAGTAGSVMGTPPYPGAPPDSTTADGKPCYGCNQHKSNQSADASFTLPNGTTVPLSTGIKRNDPIAIVQTTQGTMSIRLFRELAPRTVANFVDLSQKGFYNGLRWHRVVPGFVVQTGCPKGDGTGDYIDPATGKPRYIPMELNSRLKHNAPGVVAMARFGNDMNSASSQWYITLASVSHLDSKYAVFGGVVSGLDTIYRITPNDKVLSVVIQDQ